MKVALLLPGHYRLFEKIYDSLKKHFLDLYDVDIFIWTWDDYGYWTPNDEHPGGVFPTEKINSDFIINVVKPKLYRIENLKEHTPKINEHMKFIKEKRYHFNRPFNQTSMMYSLNNCDLLRRQYENENNFKYDIIVRGRFDLELTSPLQLSSNFTICTDMWGLPREEGYSDAFFFGNNEHMTKILDILLHLEEIGSKIPFDSHSAFRYWVDKHIGAFQYRDFGFKIWNTPGGLHKVDSLILPNLDSISSEKS